jgi:chloramphenicol 3-O-phosphotransferase
MRTRLVIISGPVGAGKTTVARELIAHTTGPTAYIEGDRFWPFIVRSVEADEGGFTNFKMIMRAMLAAARHYVRDGYETIVDFSIPPWYLDAVRALAKGQEFDYIVLLPTLAVCANRAATRAQGTIPDYARYEDMYRDFEAYESNTIENDTADPAAVAATIRAGLNAGRFRIS